MAEVRLPESLLCNSSDIDRMRECPYCGSRRIESIGFRDDTHTVRRYRCKNPECKRSHARNALTFAISAEIKTEPKLTAKKVTACVNITPYTKERLEGLKLYDRETMDDLICRLIDEHYNKVKV